MLFTISGTTIISKRTTAIAMSIKVIFTCNLRHMDKIHAIKARILSFFHWAISILAASFLSNSGIGLTIIPASIPKIASTPKNNG